MNATLAPAYTPVDRAVATRHRILLVDDDEDLRLGLQVRLTACGFQVDCAEDGAHAIHAVDQQKPDVIILDLTMPATGGFRVLDWLKGHAAVANIPVIVVTARDAICYKADALAAGAAAFFQKPVDNHQLLAEIVRVLKKAAANARQA